MELFIEGKLFRIMNCLRLEINFIRDFFVFIFDLKNIYNGNYEFLKDIIVKVI